MLTLMIGSIQNGMSKPICTSSVTTLTAMDMSSVLFGLTENYFTYFIGHFNSLPQ